MTTYAIGDLQGCYDELRRLLDRLRFDPAVDRLLLAGDLVNRGPGSLQVLRFVRSLGSAAEAVLGNHDIHLLACAHGAPLKAGDTLDEVLAAPDRDELIDWLARRPLALWDAQSEALLIHAGLPPQWTRQRALELAAEASAVLGGPQRGDFLAHLYGDRPEQWDEGLHGWERQRFIVNCLTRLRFCRLDGRVALRHKGGPGTQPQELMPWFAVPGRRSAGERIVFGHWSTLGKVAWPEARVWGLDTGCVWGGRLTALNLASFETIDCGCGGYHRPGAAD